MKHSAKRLVVALMLIANICSLASCHHHELNPPDMSRRVYNMYQNTVYMLKPQIARIQDILRVNAVFCATDSAERQQLITEYFGQQAQVFFNDSIGKISIYTAKGFNKMIIQHNHVALSDPQDSAVWSVTYQNAVVYDRINDNYFRGGKASEFTVCSQPDTNGCLNLHYHIEGKSEKAGKPVLHLFYHAPNPAVEFSTATLEIQGGIVNRYFDYFNMWMTFSTKEPLVAVFPDQQNFRGFSSGSLELLVLTDEGETVPGEATFFMEDNKFTVQTIDGQDTNTYSQK